MTVHELQQRLRGVMAGSVTPFHDDLSLDLDGLRQNIDRLASHPFCALIAIGGIGEMHSLTVEENMEVTRATLDAVRGRMPVLGTVGFNAEIARDLAWRQEKAGVAGLLVLPPYYTNAPENGLLLYYKAIAEATALPLAIYARDWAVFSPDAVARLADELPTLAAWKDGQGDARRYQRQMFRLGDRLAWLGGVGDDCAPAYFAIGVQAYTSSLCNLAPQVSIAIAEAGLAKDFVRLHTLMRRYVQPVFAIRDRSRGYEVAVMKKAMELLSMKAGPARPPLPPLKPNDVADLDRALESYRGIGGGARV